MPDVGSQKYLAPEAPRTNLLKYSMVHRTIPVWNSLPAAVAEAGSLDIFKSRLIALRP